MGNKIKLAISNALSVKVTKIAPVSVHGASGEGAAENASESAHVLSLHGAMTDPLEMMTQAPSESEVGTITSVHGAFSINLPEPHRVSRMEINRDDKGDLIIILHE